MSTKNKFEDKLLREVNLIEGISAKLFKWFLKPLVKKTLKKLKDDPEVQAAFDGIDYHRDELKRLIKKHEDEFGKSPKAKNLLRKGY